jgi:beta-N-acetylhexosaminidase
MVSIHTRRAQISGAPHVLLVLLMTVSGILTGQSERIRSSLPESHKTVGAITTEMPGTGSKATLDEMIGQMIMVGLRGTTAEANPLLVEALRIGQAGGVILFEKNLSSDSTATHLKQLIDTLQDVAAMPLLIAIDQEGGRVNRLKAKYGFPESKTATWLGDMDDCDTTMHYASSIATTLRMLGININFAPVVDLCSNPDNPIIARYGRCFSADPEAVAKHAAWYIDAHHAQRILTTLKHFPGHGSSTSDTHKEMTDVTRQWSPEELIPYTTLIANNRADAIMTAHIVNCKLDTNCLPATLSYPIITQLLRKNLGFQGVVVTDDMQMHAITKHYGLEQSIRLAILAGVDIVLFSNNIAGSWEHQANVVHRIIQQMVISGEISEERIRESYQRIIKLKKEVFPQHSFPGQ